MSGAIILATTVAAAGGLIGWAVWQEKNQPARRAAGGSDGAESWLAMTGTDGHESGGHGSHGGPDDGGGASDTGGDGGGGDGGGDGGGGGGGD